MTTTLNPPSSTGSSAPRQRQVWWRRPWIAPLMFVCAAFLAFSVPPYVTGNPENSRLPIPEGNPVYFWLLTAHVMFGTIAMTTGCFQIWPAFRARYRRGHRITGRVYVFAGVLPAGLLGFYIGWYTDAGPSVRVANLVGSALWLMFTYAAFRAARQKRFDAHRRWMSRSFALAMSIALSRVFNIAATIILTPRVDTTFGGNERMMHFTAASIGVWISPLLLLVLTDYLLERRKPTPARANRGAN